MKTTAAASAAAVLSITFEDAAKAETHDMFLHVRALVLDRPTKNMNVYPRKAMWEAIKRMPPEGIFGQVEMPHDARTNLSKISHVAKDFSFLHDCDTGEDWLTCEIQILDTPEGKRLRGMIPSGEVVFRTACQATVSEEFHGVTPCQEERYVRVIQNDVKLLGVHAVPRKDAAC